MRGVEISIVSGACKFVAVVDDDEIEDIHISRVWRSPVPLRRCQIDHGCQSHEDRDQHVPGKPNQ